MIEIEKKDIDWSINCNINSNFIVYNSCKNRKKVWYSKDLTSYGHNESFYYNIYGIKIWPFISENEHIRE